MSGVDGIHDQHGEETWHLRQLWQFAKNRGYSVKLEDDRIWLTPSEHGSAAPGRSFPDTRAGMQAARAWVSGSVDRPKVQPAVHHTSEDVLREADNQASLAFLGVVIPLLGWIFAGLSLKKLRPFDRNDPAVRAVRGKAWAAIILTSVVLLLWPVVWAVSASSSSGTGRTGATGGYQYSSVFESNFLSNCEAKGGSADACGCAMRYMEANYSYSDALSFDSNGVPPAVVSAVRAQCGGH